MTILVTGGNRGIGRALVKAVAGRGERVIFTVRDEGRGLAALDEVRGALPDAEIEFRHCDLASPASIRTCAAAINAEVGELAAVVHNAGVLRSPERRTLTPEGVEVTLATNALGPLLLTLELEPSLAAGPSCRVLALTSRLHQPGSRGEPVDFDFADPTLERGYSADRAYKNSKLALIWVARELDRRLPPSVTVNAICPGFVPTTAAAYTTGLTRLLMRHVLPRLPFSVSVTQAAGDVLWALDAPELSGVGGRYLLDRTIGEPSTDARDDAAAARFWTWVTEVLDLDPR